MTPGIDLWSTYVVGGVDVDTGRVVDGRGGRNGVKVDIVLPRVVGTRPSAQAFLREVPQQLSGMDVVLDCRGLMDGTASFADEIVRAVLCERGASSLVALGPGPDFAEDLISAAQDHDVQDRFKIARVIESVAS